MMRLERILRLQERRDDGGFSLVELAVAIAVFSIVMTVILGTVLNVMNASNSFQERTQEQADTRLAIDLLVRDLRQAYQTPGTNSISVTTDTTITFFSPDRATDFHLRQITYTLVGTDLKRSEATSPNAFSNAAGWGTFPAMSTPVVVLTGIRNLKVFTYLDQSNPPVVSTTFASLRSVLIDLVVDLNPNTSPTAQTYHTQVDLRVI